VKEYHINIFYREEDGGYSADVPDLVSCSAFGSTPEKALAEVEKAKAAWIDVATAAGKAVPPPRNGPASYHAAPLPRLRPGARPRAGPGLDIPAHLY